MIEDLYQKAEYCGIPGTQTLYYSTSWLDKQSTGIIERAWLAYCHAINLIMIFIVHILYPREREPTMAHFPLWAQFPTKVKCLLEYTPMVMCSFP